MWHFPLHCANGRACKTPHPHRWTTVIRHADFADGTSRVDTYKVGDVHFRAKDSIHRITNVGNAR